ncbi:MAG: response regulator transcription factor [Mitsuaria chitosanitabida]|jgi:DNA-binding NarL/FixJ family response regulator|uniref:response regulator n=1 Tax=Roseateles chitosanitabidus TaxID=65048 RepID=UPI001B20D862|nr:response regulator [Roseateles chitosanitabidus]MBO9685272.1 response regulator transcription factor [Roseateles chitosanitabidus]
MKILLVDPCDLWMATLRRRLQDVPGATVVAQVSREADAVMTATLCRPDVILCDVALEKGSGLSVVRHLRKAGFRGAAYVVSNADECLVAHRCAEAGVNGFFDREMEVDDLLRTLRTLGATPLTFGQPKMRLAEAA